MEEWIYEAERATWSRASRIVANLYEEGLVREYRPRDFRSYQEYKAEREQRKVGYSSEENNGNYTIGDERTRNIKDNQEDVTHGHSSQELDLIDYINERAEAARNGNEVRAYKASEKMLQNRQLLANALESINEYPSERGLLSSYRATAERLQRAASDEIKSALTIPTKSDFITK